MCCHLDQPADETENLVDMVDQNIVVTGNNLGDQIQITDLCFAFPDPPYFRFLDSWCRIWNFSAIQSFPGSGKIDCVNLKSSTCQILDFFKHLLVVPYIFVLIMFMTIRVIKSKNKR